MYRAYALFLLVFIISGSLLLSGIQSARAQVSTLAGAPAPITLDVEPNYPAPYQTVTITPSSSVFDMSAATVSVTVNGTLFYKGTGGAPINIPMGAAGSVSRIVITASAEGQSYNDEVDLQPASVALVVEPVTSTHPFYAGGGLVTPNGRVRLVAVPDIRTSSGKVISPASLEYTWKFGDQILEEDSGIGKSVLDATAPQEYRDAAITLTVSDPNTGETAQAQTDITTNNPLVRIYENDPLMGPLYDNALSGTVTMAGAEDTYRGVPYYFSGTPSLVWGVNGNSSGTDNDITVRASGNGQGQAVLNFAANESDNSESANSTLSVNFGQQQSTGLFGL